MAYKMYIWTGYFLSRIRCTLKRQKLKLKILKPLKIFICPIAIA